MTDPAVPSAETTATHRAGPLAKDILLIVIGSFLEALAYGGFIAPNDIIPGGVYGITIALHELTRGVFAFAPDGLPIGTTALFFNVPLLLLAMHKLGLKSGPKTVLTFILISLFTDGITLFLDHKPIIDDMILASCYGGAILGVGVYFVFRAESTSAGTDVLGRIIAKGRNIKLGTCIIIIDSIVVVFGLLVFRDIKVPLYSWLTIFIYGRVVEFLSPENPKKAVFIVSSQVEPIRQCLSALGVRGSILHGRGMYESVEREVLFIVAERKTLRRIRSEVRALDPKAFISTMDAGEDPLPIPKAPHQ